MSNTGKSADRYAKAKEFLRQWWIWFINKEIRFSHKPRPETKPENAIDKAARRTAFATVMIAIFTAVLIDVNYVQLRGIQGSGVESSNQINQMIKEMRSQVAQLKRQVGETHELAIQAIIQAKAARSTAETARDALTISEKAYILSGETPEIDTERDVVTLFFANYGRRPSGPVEVIEHDAIFDANTGLPHRAPHPPITKVEGTWRQNEWRQFKMPSLAPAPVTKGKIMIAVPGFSKTSTEALRETITISGLITYNDGFKNDPPEKTPFCWRSEYDPLLKGMLWNTCDPNLMTPQLEKLDGYPNGKKQAETTNPN